MKTLSLLFRPRAIGANEIPGAERGDTMNFLNRRAFEQEAQATDIPAVLFTASESNATRKARETWQKILHRSKSEIGADIFTITPELAELMLRSNPDNRVLKPIKIGEISQDIREGRFILNGETIIISKCGRLNDGQNRLTAVVETGRPIKTFVAFGVPRDARLTVDTGTVRTTGDFLGMQGLTHANGRAHIAALLWQFSKSGAIAQTDMHAMSRPSKAQLLEFAKPFQSEIEMAIQAVPSTGAGKLASHSFLAFAAMIIAREAGMEDVSAFMTSLIKGENLSSSSAIYLTRERLLDEKRRGKMRKQDTLEVILRGWNAYRTKKRITKIQISGQLPRIAG